MGASLYCRHSPVQEAPASPDRNLAVPAGQKSMLLNSEESVCRPPAEGRKDRQAGGNGADLHFSTEIQRLGNIASTSQNTALSILRSFP